MPPKYPKLNAERKNRVASFAQRLMAALFLGMLFGGCSKSSIDGVVVGGSMYPTLKGRHYQVTCRDCEFKFECDAGKIPRTNRFVCPNCGYANNRVLNASEMAPQSIEITKLSRPLRRWDVVCFNDKSDGRLIVKRLVGLPGESVAIEKGLVHINGTPVFPGDSIKELIVFDSYYQSSNAESPPRFVQSNVVENQSNRMETGWKRNGRSWVFEKPLERPNEILANSELPWLRYQHRRCFSTFTEDRTDVIEDHYGFNQTTSRDLNKVDRLKYQVNVNITTTQSLCWQFQNRLLRLLKTNENLNWALMEVPFNGNVNEPQADWLIAKGCVHVTAEIEGLNIHVLNIEWDRLYGNEVLTIGEEIVHQSPSQVSDTIQSFPIFRVGTVNDSAQLNRLIISRGVYFYNDRTRRASAAPVKLKSDEYFVLGDNPPLSRDSRQFLKPLKKSDILGIVKPK